MTGKPGRPPRALIIGGGLAAMTVAKELRKQQIPVTILEGGTRLGGKAGADPAKGSYEEHGFHVFPAWYLNTRQLLRELGVDGNLIDLDHLQHLRKGDFPRFVTYYAPDSVPNLLHNTFHGLLPWHQSLLTFYFSLELASQPFSRRGFLDRLSVNGFLHSRWYRSEAMAGFQQHTLLQAGAVPSHELSAMSMHNLLQYWIEKPRPVFSLLNANLHAAFIEPFAQRLRDLGATIELQAPVAGLKVRDGRIAGVRLVGDRTLPDVGRDDIFVLATPPEVTKTFVDAEVYAAEDSVEEDDDFAPPRLADTHHLRSVPMAALHLYLRRRVPGIPDAHVTLYQSRYQMSFVDVSQHWRGLEHTTLSMIASNFAPLAQLPEEEMAHYLIDELRAYIPEIEPDDIERCYLQPNVRVPLFLNTVGSWTYRPCTRTRIPNLYTAGDYCRTDADVTTMESAVMSGLYTARDVLKDEGLPADVGLVPLAAASRAMLLLYRFLSWPFIAPVGVWNIIGRRLGTA